MSKVEPLVDLDGTWMKPTLHKPVPMGARVVIPEHYLGKPNVTGTVAGISSMHVIFIYIVILDEEIDSEYGKQKAVVVNGPELVGINGENWKLDA